MEHVWIFDSNRRKYIDGKIVYAEHFVKVPVVRETPRSWVVKYQNTEYNVNKTTRTIPTAKFGMSAIVYFSQDDVDNAVWVHDNAYRIATMVRDCKSAATLKVIEAYLQDNT